MKKEELLNWKKIKEHMEENGHTDNHYYTRACAIVQGLPDPIEPLPNEEKKNTEELE